MKKKIITVACMLSLLVSGMAMPLTAYADGTKMITVGADLTEDQKEKVLQFFNANLDEVEIIEVNNTEERQYLEGIVEEGIIGHRTLSCAYINPNTHDGIMVKTANLTWVTAEMIGNALLTAGVSNCEVIATAPFEVSGTGALTGIFKAYEYSTGETLDEEKKELATEEIIISAELSDSIEHSEEADDSVNSVNNLISDIKQDILEGDEDVETIVKKHIATYALDLTEEQINKIIAWAEQFKQMDYDKSAFEDSLNKLSENIEKLKNLDISITSSIDTDEALNFFQKLWKAIVDFFKGLFASNSDAPETSETPETLAEDNIFQQANEEIFSFDGEEADETENEEEKDPEISMDEFQVEPDTNSDAVDEDNVDNDAIDDGVVDSESAANNPENAEEVEENIE